MQNDTIAPKFKKVLKESEWYSQCRQPKRISIFKVFESKNRLWKLSVAAMAKIVCNFSYCQVSR